MWFITKCSSCIKCCVKSWKSRLEWAKVRNFHNSFQWDVYINDQLTGITDLLTWNLGILQNPFQIVTSCHNLAQKKENHNRQLIANSNYMSVFLFNFPYRPHSQPCASVPTPAVSPLPVLHLDHVRSTRPQGRDVGPNQHRDGHRICVSLPEGRGPRRGEGEAGGRRLRLGKRGSVYASAVHAALPRAQHGRTAGYPCLCCYTAR